MKTKLYILDSYVILPPFHSSISPMKKILLALVTLTMSVSMSAQSGFAATPSEDQAYARWLAYLEERGFVQPFSTWKTQPDVLVTKIEFLSMIVNRLYPMDVKHMCFAEIAPNPRRLSYTLLFKDIKRVDPIAQVACVGLKIGLVSGHTDGTFGPNSAITLAEASKILVKSYGLAFPRSMQRGENWYDNYIFDLRNRGGIPATLTNPGKALTRRDVARMLYGLRYREARFGLAEPWKMEPSSTSTRPRTLPVRPLHSR